MSVLKEIDIVRACLTYLKLRGIHAWRVNNMGVMRAGGGFSFSGTPGISDICGLLPKWSKQPGKILCIEVKKPRELGGKGPTNDQKSFLNRVTDDMGIAMVVRSIDELKEELARYL